MIHEICAVSFFRLVYDDFVLLRQRINNYSHTQRRYGENVHTLSAEAIVNWLSLIQQIAFLEIQSKTPRQASGVKGCLMKSNRQPFSQCEQCSLLAPTHVLSRREAELVPTNVGWVFYGRNLSIYFGAF